MADYNSLNTDRAERLAQSLLGIRNGAIVATLAPELQLQVQLPMAEDAWLASQNVPFGSGTFQAAVAAEFGYLLLRNISESSIIVGRFSIGGSTAAIGACAALDTESVASPGGATVLGSLISFRDGRRNNPGIPLNSLFVLQQGTSAVGPFGNPFSTGSVFWSALFVAATYGWSPWFVLPPNTRAWVMSNSANIAVHLSFEGYIRDALPDELRI